jgi:hypothetical protein
MGQMALCFSKNIGGREGLAEVRVQAFFGRQP